MPSLPPGVSRKDFQDAIAQFQAAVGKEWVFTSDEDVDLYRDSYSPFWHEPEDPVPSAAVAPDGVEQVQQIVRIANKYKIPLWTVSTGKNLAYGGSAPRLSGSVVLDLKRMNRILEVNDRNHYALVEPGVSYFDLYRYTQEKGLNVFIDAPDPGWGSPVGNTLDRGGGHTPLRDHFSTLCGMEVVLANGDVVRTGMGALPNSRTWQQYKYGFGPYVDGIFTQSNYGIVTKMGVWLYPMPEMRFTGTVSVPKHDDLIPMVDTLSYLMNSNIVLGYDERGQFAKSACARPGTDRAALETGRSQHTGAGRISAGQEPSLLEHRAAVLRSHRSSARAVGVCEEEVFRHSGRAISRWRIEQAAAWSRRPGEGGESSSARRA